MKNNSEQYCVGRHCYQRAINHYKQQYKSASIDDLLEKYKELRPKRLFEGGLGEFKNNIKNIINYISDVHRRNEYSAINQVISEQHS